MSIKGDLAMARVMSHCGGSPTAGLRFAAGAVVRDPGSLEPCQLLAEIREQYPDTGADQAGLAGLLTDAYLARWDGDMGAAATAPAWVSGLAGHALATPGLTTEQVAAGRALL